MSHLTTRKQRVLKVLDKQVYSIACFSSRGLVGRGETDSPTAAATTHGLFLNCSNTKAQNVKHYFFTAAHLQAPHCIHSNLHENFPCSSSTVSPV